MVGDEEREYHLAAGWLRSLRDSSFRMERLGPDGKAALRGLCQAYRQLIVCHYMWPDGPGTIRAFAKGRRGRWTVRAAPEPTGAVSDS